jgi:ATP-dependent RNA helicase RhlE
MQKENSYNRRGNSQRGNFRRKNRHPGLAENQPKRRLETPKGEIPEEFAKTVFGSVNPLLQHAAVAQGFKTPTPIQEQSIPELIKGRDIFGCAQTGTGKTAAFLLPILNSLLESGGKSERGKPRVLIIAPTRELAAQIAESVVVFARYTKISFAVIFGGVSQQPQVRALNNCADIVVATPGRLLDLMNQRYISLDAIEHFVLDEADRLLDMGFLPDIKRVLEALPEKRQTMFFSATLSKEVMKLSNQMVHDPAHVEIDPGTPTVDKINQSLMFVDKGKKSALLIWLLDNVPEMKRVIVFARMRHSSDTIAKKLCQAGIYAAAIHSDKTQRMRTSTMDDFRKGKMRVLIATDIASRGIDVDGITHVVNYDLPEENESYVHRIGRTARAGSEGSAISFISKGQRNLLRGIEGLLKKEIPRDKEQPYHDEAVEKSLFGGGAKEKPQGRFKRFRNPTRGKNRGAVKPDRKNRSKPGFRKSPSASGSASENRARAEGESRGSARPARPARPPRGEHPRAERPARTERPARATGASDSAAPKSQAPGEKVRKRKGKVSKKPQNVPPWMK